MADLSGIDQGWIELAARSGLRVFAAPSFASAHWHLENHWQLKYAWDEPAGRAGLDAALRLIEQAQADPSGRLSGIVSPAQIDTGTADLLRESHAAALEKNLPFTTHCSQSVNEFNEMTSRHGITPVQWANQLGIFDRSTILGHAIFIDRHSWTRWHTDRDLPILAETATNVAHCPSPFARYGQTLEHFGRYRSAGVNLGIGTDVAPHNLIEEIRLAATIGRIAAEDITATSLNEVFHAATAGGAQALGRWGAGADRYRPAATRRQGRSGAGRSDQPLDDAGARPAAITGLHRCRPGDRAGVHRRPPGGARATVLTVDHAAALAALTEAQARMIAAVPSHDWAHRGADRITPRSLPMADALTGLRPQIGRPLKELASRA
ncbi:amidohydrolase family protein [Rhodopila sp.]|uniref:amidohydrolase family protein n=1 Tax=Rhodopila sp. TaxID=2480087 RepID=UPI003D0EADA9